MLSFTKKIHNFRFCTQVVNIHIYVKIRTNSTKDEEVLKFLTKTYKYLCFHFID